MSLQERLLNLRGRIPAHPSVKTRLALLVLGIVGVGILSLVITGSIIPSDNQEANIFQSGILLVIFGSLFLEDKFTKPADAVFNAIAAVISLVPIYSPLGHTVGWRLVIAYSLFVFLAGITNLVAATKYGGSKTRTLIARSTYYLSTILGKSNVIFSIVFLFSVFSFYGVDADKTAVLVVFWGIYVSLWPLRIPHIIQAIFSNELHPSQKGVAVRVDSPDLVRVRLHPNTQWEGNLVACLGDGTRRRVLPLYTQVQDEHVIGTGLLLETVESAGARAETGSVYETSAAFDDCPEPVGFVAKGSQIARIHFETWRPQDLREGLLVYCHIGDEAVYYQVTDAATTEETFEQHRHGFQVVEAHQLGTLNPKGGFRKFTWVPQMNTPVYLAGCEVQETPLELPPSQMCLGIVPGSNVEVVCDIDEMISHHTAILGVTGSGKTELAYTIIKKAVENGVKVFCVDITGHYSERLSDFEPQDLSISDELANELGQKLHDVETGTYGAPKEKEALKEFADPLRVDIEKNVKEFLVGDGKVAIFTMPSISNTKATILATEIYLSSILKYGREKHGDDEKKRILVVLEEAHTVIPEASTMGLGDFDSKGMVAKIAQIALQGRKYDVGLLVIAQRTATVSKTVLTQCNTMISFASFDQTGLSFLSNIYGAEHTARISNLPFLHALVFGKGIKSERPVVVEIPRKPELEI